MADPINPYSSHPKADIRSQAMLLDNISEGVVVRCGDAVVFANSAIFRILGAEPDDTSQLEKHLEDWIHPDDLDRINQMYSQRMAGADMPSNYEFRLVRLDGSSIWVSSQASLSTWGGEPCLVAYLNDITAEIESRDKQKLSNGLFKNIFNVTPEFMLLFRLTDNVVIDTNPSFLNIFGHRKEGLLGNNIRALDMWLEPTFFDRFIEELKTTASLTDVPAALKTRGGIIRHFRLFARRIDGGTEPLLLMTGRDVTEELSHAHELQRTRDAAELSNRTKSEFLANMSHELRTPLNAILGFSELIRDGVGGEMLAAKHSEYASDIHKSGAHLLSIINDILDLSKVEAGRLEAHISLLDPIPCLEMCMRLVQQRAVEAGVKISSDLDFQIMLMADERLLKQIGLNLLSNAVKFTRKGGKVDLSLKKTSDGGACLVVEDTGIGMTTAEIAQAKVPFGQVESSLNRSHEGSGLGLPLVVAFAAKLGGSVSIESKPAIGTRVSVFFPAETVSQRPDSIPMAASA